MTAVTDPKEFQRFERRPLKETLDFFEISHGSYQPFNFLPYLSLSSQYSIRGNSYI